MSSAFSNDGAAAIERTTEVQVTELKDIDVEIEFEISRCCKWISENNFQQVALQFPDELLSSANSVCTKLREKCSGKVFVLGDTYYGSCCVDCVAAQHHNADSIIHFGHACLSDTQSLPILYVFGQESFDVEHFKTCFKELFPDLQSKILVTYDCRYHYCREKIQDSLASTYPNVVISDINMNNSTKGDTSKAELLKDDDNKYTEEFGRTFGLPINANIEDYGILYIGTEGLTLKNLMLSNNKCTFYTYNPTTREGRQETLNVNKMLMKRYFMIEKAKDAQIVGILAGTLGVKDYLSTIDRLKKILRAAGKKTYTFVVGKVNVAKLANFMEVDVYVLVACPENSLIDSTDFYKPIVTPFEIEVACNQAREWTGDYVLDFGQLLPGANKHVPFDENLQSRLQDVSLITGKVRQFGIEKDEKEETSGAVVKKENSLISGTVAGEFLQERLWSGLEEKLGQTPVAKAVEGRKGIASGYEEEPKT